MKPITIATWSCLTLAAAFLIALRFEHIVTSLAYLCGCAAALIAVVTYLSATSSSQNRQLSDDGPAAFAIFVGAAWVGGTVAGAYVAVRAMAAIDIGFVATASIGCGLLGKMATDALIKYLRNDPSDCDPHLGSVLVQVGLTAIAIGWFLHTHPISFPEHIQVAFDRENPLMLLVPGQFSEVQGELRSMNGELAEAALVKLVMPLSVFLSVCTVFDHITTPGWFR